MDRLKVPLFAVRKTIILFYKHIRKHVDFCEY